MLPSVDYTAPQAPAAWGAGGLAVPPVPLPEARSHQQPSLPVCEDRLSLRELEIALGGVALTSEGELCELSLWCGGLQPIGTQLPQASPNTVAKQLCFAPSASGATTAASGPPAPLHEHVEGAVSVALQPPWQHFAIYQDDTVAPATAAPVAATSPAAAAAPMAAPPLAAPRRAPLANRTNNLQPSAPSDAGGGDAVKKQMQELSTKLHVAASQRVKAEVVWGDVWWVLRCVTGDHAALIMHMHGQEICMLACPTTPCCSFPVRTCRRCCSTSCRRPAREGPRGRPGSAMLARAAPAVAVAGAEAPA